MYDPVKDGVDKTVQSVSYVEVAPPEGLSALVHRYWELKTDHELPQDFLLHALPDACTNVLFDQLDPEIAGVTALQTTYLTLNLGRSFHFVGVQLYPGVWTEPAATVDHYVGEPYEGSLPLVATSYKLAEVDFDAKQSMLSEFVEQLWSEWSRSSEPAYGSDPDQPGQHPFGCGYGRGRRTFVSTIAAHAQSAHRLYTPQSAQGPAAAVLVSQRLPPGVCGSVTLHALLSWCDRLYALSLIHI